MKTLEQQLIDIENYIPLAEKINTTISAGNVSWHLAHNLIVIENIIKALQKSNPEEYVKKFNKIRFMVLTFGKIPRGKAKAPEIALPKQVFSINDLKEKLQLVKTMLPILNNLPANAFFNHPYFGHLNLKQAKRNLTVHTNHHLKIVKDIVG
jgi:hypothetical protein